MHDLRLVGVHDDGEHLLLVDGQGERYLLAVDDALRAAVRRDRAHLGQLQLETQGGLRPRDVQSRIRAGATSEEVAAVAGWSVEKVRRYEGPVLAERAHVADQARRVRLRRRGGEPVLLGDEVTNRLRDRGVDERTVLWDSWRTEGGPWTVVVHFAAGGRERQARWHLDLASSSVTPTDDEARWLSEESAPAEGPVAGMRLTAVPSSGVYDIEADGGVGPSAPREGASFDLVTAMRSRRREPGRGVPSRAATARTAVPDDDPAGVPGSRHPARRRRPQPEPLELDPTLMDDPPAAHPPASAYDPEVAAQETVEVTAQVAAHVAAQVAADEVVRAVAADELVAPVTDAVAPPALDQPLPADLLDEVLGRAAASVVAPEAVESEAVESEAVESPAVESPAAAVADEPHVRASVPAPVQEVEEESAREAGVEPAVEPAAAASGTDDAVGAPTAAPAPANGTSSEPARRNTRQRSNRGGRNRRSSVPSWDDIMFGAKKD
jgi:hypothetical protein